MASAEDELQSAENDLRLSLQKYEEAKTEEAQEKTDFELTEKQASQLAFAANCAVAINGIPNALHSLKNFTAYLFVMLALWLLSYPAVWYFTARHYEAIFKAQYEAKTADYIATAKAGAAWAMSESGQEAQALDKEGLLQGFYHCRLKGFYKKRKDGNLYCFPDNSGYGWLLPDSD